MHHAYADNHMVFDEPIDSFAGAYGAPIMSQEFYDTDVARGFVNGFTYQIGRGATPAPAALGLPWGVRSSRGVRALLQPRDLVQRSG